MTVSAPAKVNLTLEVLGLRPDGFHELRSVMQSISLCDTLEIVPGAGLSLECDALDVPADESNLVMRAARALDAAAGGGYGARIHLTKRIPSAAGLGGGSSDAAAALRGLNALWGLGLSTPRLAEIAATLGSDVPFFLTGGTALAEGRGERLSPLAAPPRTWLVVAHPGAPLSTPAVYRAHDEINAAAPEAGDRSARMAAALPAGARAMADGLVNDLEPAAFALLDAARALRDALLQAGALGALLSGSGSAVFGVASDEAHAHRILETLRPEPCWAAVCHTAAVPSEPTP